jgi:hypothetical protein
MTSFKLTQLIACEVIDIKLSSALVEDMNVVAVLKTS